MVRGEEKKAPEFFPRLSWGLFNASEPGEDTAPANQRFSSASAALNRRH